MKTYYLLLLLWILFPSQVFSQTGINTPNPQGSFHVDAKKNNPVSGAVSSENAEDDFIITDDGKVGIHTLNPQQKVEINAVEAHNSGLRLSGSTPTSTTEKQKVNVLGVNADGDVIVVANLPEDYTCTTDFFYGYSENETNINVNNDHKITGLTSNFSHGITENNGEYTLIKGNTYRLEATFRNGKTTSGDAYFSYEFYDTDSGVALPHQTQPKAVVMQNTDEGFTGIQPYLLTYITPENDITIAVRIKNVQGSGNSYTPSHSYLAITQLNPCFLD